MTIQNIINNLQKQVDKNTKYNDRTGLTISNLITQINVLEMLPEKDVEMTDIEMLNYFKAKRTSAETGSTGGIVDDEITAYTVQINNIIKGLES